MNTPKIFKLLISHLQLSCFAAKKVSSQLQRPCTSDSTLTVTCYSPSVVNVVVVGPFEEGTGVASNVVKVQGEDPATPGPMKRNDPGTVTIPQYQVNKTNQHTTWQHAYTPF